LHSQDASYRLQTCAVCMLACIAVHVFSHTLFLKHDSISEPLTPLTPPPTAVAQRDQTHMQQMPFCQAPSNTCCSLCYKPSQPEMVTFFCTALPLTQTIIQCTQPCSNSDWLGRSQALRVLLRIMPGVNDSHVHFWTMGLSSIASKGC